MAKPIGLRVRMYRVGFGDCFLLTFEYKDPQPDRHVLVDFGTTRMVPGGRTLEGIAELIRDHSGGHLDAVVVSHRHKDHLSAFGDKDIAALLTGNGPPAVVIRPWTEDPKAPAEAGAASRRFLKSLNAARHFADRLAERVAAAGAAPNSVSADLKRAAEDQVRNAAAVKRLDEWAKAGNAAYLHYGQPSGLEDLLPGVRVRVLGPPTIEQHPDVEGGPAQEHEEFWMLYNRLLSADSPELTPAVELDEKPDELDEKLGAMGPTRWLIEKMARQQANSFLRVVRRMDDALNNTSLILLFEVPCAGGTKRLLFCGDAQIENWEYALDKAPDAGQNRNLLRKVDLYKVGHHGSRNATPKKALFGLWLEPKTIGREMVALLSTNKDKDFGDPGSHTEVPRLSLVTALRDRMRLYSTDEFEPTQDFVELTVDLTEGGPFIKV